jgi:Putative Ig domain
MRHSVLCILEQHTDGYLTRTNMSNINDFKNLNTTFGGSDGITVPNGTTSGVGPRPASPNTGQLRYNSSVGLAEFYTANGWTAVAAPPAVTSISGFINADNTTTITVNGSNFVNGATVNINGPATSNVLRALTTTYINTTQLTATTNSSVVNYVGNAAFDVTVINPSGLSSTLASAGVVDRTLIWSTGAGTIATISDVGGSYSPIATVSASDPDGQAVTLALTSGSVPTGSSFNTGNGQITGQPSAVSSQTTYTFTITATSNGISVPRTFNIVVNPALDGTTSARANTSAANIKSVVPSVSSGVYWIKSSGINSGTPFQVYCDFTLDGGIGYAMYFQQYFDSNQDPGTSAGFEAGPTHTAMQSTGYTGTAGYASEYNAYPYLMPAQYNNGSGASRMIIFNRTNGSGSSAGGITSSTYKALRFTGLSTTGMRDIWATNPTTNQYSCSWNTTGNTGSYGGSGTAYIIDNHGSSGGVQQWGNGTGQSNNNIVFEYKPDSQQVNGGYTDPNHYWMVNNGENTGGNSYYRAHPEYGGGSQTFLIRWGGILVY